MTISPEQVLTVIGGSVAIVTAIWHAAMYVGRLTVQVQRHEDRINEHDKAIDRLEAVAR